MAKTTTKTEIFTPSSFVSGTYRGITGQDNPVGKTHSNTTYAAVSAVTGSQAETFAFWAFDCSSIPENATINSVTCVARCYVSSTSYIATRQVQLYVGTTEAKGEGTTFSNSTTATQTLDCGTWTRDELSNCYIRIYGQRGTSNTTRSASMRFYGASLTVNYSYKQQTINAVSNTDLASIVPEEQDVDNGGIAQVFISTDELDSIKVEDNGNDVTDLLVETHGGTGSTVNAYPSSLEVDGLVYSSSDVGSTSTAHTICIGLGVDNASTTTDSVYAPSSQGRNTYIYYNFDFSDIPLNAEITSVQVQVRGHVESTSSSSLKAGVQLFSGDVAKGDEDEFTSTSNTTLTLNAGSWTREELQEAKLRFEIALYGGLIVGATFTVSYTTPTSVYYTYTINNVQSDHMIVVSEDSIIPPYDEDTGKTYYPVTISSINARTTPSKGTTRIESGTSETIYIYPTDTKLTLATDNGTDISNQLVFHGVSPSYTISNITTQYGFELNSSTGYYTSTNKGVSSSAAVARVNFTLPSKTIVTFDFINNGEETYDFGVFSKIDTALSTSAWTASSAGGDVTTDAGLEQLRLNTATYNTTSVQTITYEIEAGEHFIDIKYAKDQSSDSGYDTLQFKISDIHAVDGSSDYYTYELQNINQAHSLIFIFGDVQYYFINSSSDGKSKIYPDGQMVQLQGDNYKLTVVVEKSSDTVQVIDNNMDVTSQLEKKHIEMEKDGAIVTVVNYIYHLSNISAAHNIQVTTQSNQLLFLKVNGMYTSIGTVYYKEDGRWKTITDILSILDNNNIYIMKNLLNGV